MGKTFDNDLSDAQAERLAILAEELGEAIQIVGKILRHGFDSINPKKPNGPTNKEMLECELGDIQWIVELMSDSGDVSSYDIRYEQYQKAERVLPYLHHQHAYTTLKKYKP